MSEDTTTEAPAKAPKTPKRGVGAVIREAIRAGKTNEEALAAAKAEFPQSNTTAATVSWYRNDLRKKEGDAIPSARDAKKAGEPEAGGDTVSGTDGADTVSGGADADPLA